MMVVRGMKRAGTAVAGRAKSFRHAFDGLGFVLRTQPNARVHLGACILVCAVATLLGVSPADWCRLIIAMMLVCTAEVLNTALEFLCDVVSPGYRQEVKRAKDIAAGAVLISATGAAVLGAVTFLPYLR